MRTRREKSRLTWAVVVGVALIMSAPLSAQAAGPDRLTLYRVNTEAFPKTVLEVGLPDSLIGDPGETPEFVVRENGVKVDVLDVSGGAQGSRVRAALLIDTSGSMKGQPLRDAKVAAHRFIDDLSGRAEVAIVEFNSSPRVALDYTSDAAALGAAIDSLQADGETAVYDAVVSATQLTRAENGAPTTIVLLSDGGDTASTGTLDQAVKAVKSDGMPILAVALKSPDFNQQSLTLMSTRSGGRVMSVDDSAKLTEFLGSLAREIGSVYQVTYRSRKPTTKNIDLDIVATTTGGSAKASTTLDNPLYVTRIPVGSSTVVVPTSNPLLLIGAALLAFASVGLLTASVLTMRGSRSKSLDQMRFYDQLQGGQGASADGDSTNGITEKLVDAVGVVAGKGGFLQVIHVELERAGLPLRPAEYIAAHVVFVAVVGFIGQLAFDRLWVSLGIVVFASIGPLAILSSRGRKRTRDFETQLPDVLNLLAGGLRTGWGLQQAIDLVVTEGDKPAADEFRRVQIEARLGVPIETSLQSMADRLDSDMFRWVVSAVAIQREVGGNLAEVLDNVAKSVRDRDALYRQVAALTAEGRISAIILTALPFVVAGGMFVVSPDYIRTGLSSPLGLPVIGLAVVLLIIGVVWLRAVSRIEY